MILPSYSIGTIANNLVRLAERYGQLSGDEWELFQLCCRAWEERTGDAVTFGMLEIIKEVYG